MPLFRRFRCSLKSEYLGYRATLPPAKANMKITERTQFLQLTPLFAAASPAVTSKYEPPPGSPGLTADR
jgi:hypothetical protein